MSSAFFKAVMALQMILYQILNSTRCKAINASELNVRAAA